MRYSSVSRFCAARMRGEQGGGDLAGGQGLVVGQPRQQEPVAGGQVPQVDEWVGTGAVGRGHENSLERSCCGLGGGCAGE